MQFFHYQDNCLLAEQVPLAAIAERHGTPCYVYSRAALETQWRAFDEALAGLEHRICYSVKANSNLGVLDVLARLGSGFDIVSVGELERVLAAGGEAAKTVFSGVGKGEAEMRRALDAGVYCFNIESQEELARLDTVAATRGQVASIQSGPKPIRSASKRYGSEPTASRPQACARSLLVPYSVPPSAAFQVKRRPLPTSSLRPLHANTRACSSIRLMRAGRSNRESHWPTSRAATCYS